MQKNYTYLLIGLSIIVTTLACDSIRNTDLTAIEVEWSDGFVRPALNPSDTALKVFIFMAPECPLCINATESIVHLADTFGTLGVSFFSVYPGDFYNANDIKKFEDYYNLKFPAMFDTRNEIAKALKATVTPQAVLLSREGYTIYTGAIDNRAFAPGKKRQVVSEYYLQNAITATLAGNKPDVPKTEAIGCLIEF